MIIAELNRIQVEHGYLPREELQAAARRLKVPLYRIHEVASFYPLYRLEPPPQVHVKVCRDMACHLMGSRGLREKVAAVATLADRKIIVEGVSCLGQCDRPVAVAMNDRVFSRIGIERCFHHIVTIARGEELPSHPADRSPLAWTIEPYQGQPPYQALRKFVETLDPDEVLRQLDTANLRGMGGAGFPTARKWAAVRSAPGDTKYVICNADESEPGTFKERELPRRPPWLMMEGMVIAGLVPGARQGWIYLRHE